MGRAKVDEARMTSRLALLHSRLTRLRRTRAAVVALSTAAGIMAAVLLALFAVFLLDWFFGLDVYQRLIVMALAGATSLYFVRKIWRESRGARGGEIQAALWVERQHQIDSDLVAAIQFERDAREDLTSRRLAAAVVEYVAEAAPAINVFQGFSAGPLAKRLTLMAGCIAVATGLVLVTPNHVRAFGQRLLLGSQAYPTRTQIARVMVGEAVVFVQDKSELPLAEAKGAEAQALEFVVVCSGTRPAAAVAHVRSAEGGPGTRVALKPVGTAPGQEGMYRGELPRVHEDLQYWITAGDARTSVGFVRMIPLPTVEVVVKATPPDYAGTTNEPSSPLAGNSVLESSSVELVVECTNGKALESVLLSLQGSTGSKQIALVASDKRKLRWTLPADDSSLAAIAGDVRYEVQAKDIDGLSPLAPVRGVIRVHPDERPSAAASVVHRLVLPTAEPVVSYRAWDDHGVARLQLVVDVERASPAPSTAEAGSATPPLAAETQRFDVPLPAARVSGDALPLTGSYALALAPLNLIKGDRLKLTLEATDYRGESAAGVTAASDALVLEVADESAVLAAIRQADERSEAQLNEIIRRQLGVGQEP
jgi:hypothetical protein